MTTGRLDEPTDAAASPTAGRGAEGDTEPDAGPTEGEAAPAQSWRRDALALALLFLVSRVVLTVIGVVSRASVPGVPGRPRPEGVGETLSRFPFLDIWGMWDSSWYLTIAEVGYKPQPQVGASYAFFPLYPYLARIVGWPIGSSYVGGLIVSNVSLLLAGWFLFRLVRLDDDADAARRAVKYLFVAPGAFLFSAMLTESLYLALVVACFYYARRDKWHVVGLLGVLLTLSRGPGVFTAIPLLWIYLQQRGFSLRRVRPSVLWLAGLPAGIAVFMWINKRAVGDPLAFARIQRTGWNHYLQNPFPVMWRELRLGDVGNKFNSWYVLGVLGLGAAFLRTLGVAYGLFVLISVAMPIVFGPSYYSMVRYTAVVFPLYIALARVTKDRPGADQLITLACALFQGFLMAVWVNGSILVI